MWLFNYIVDFVKQTKQTLISQFQAYFLRKDLSKDELAHQIKVIRVVTRAIMAFVTINILRIAYRIVQAMLKANASKAKALALGGVTFR